MTAVDYQKRIQVPWVAKYQLLEASEQKDIKFWLLGIVLGSSKNHFFLGYLALFLRIKQLMGFFDIA